MVPIRLAAPVATLLIFSGCLTGGPHPPSASSTDYPDLLASPIRGLTPNEIEELRTGAGAGMALAAELNGYPGPKHILELAERLALSQDQQADVEALFSATNAEARRIGALLLGLHKELDDGFRNRTLTESGLHDLLVKLDGQTAELRFVHLRAHLAAFDLLTPHQRAMYAEMRGYGAAEHGSHAH